METLFTEEQILAMGPIERELYIKARDQRAFYTVQEAAEIAHEHFPQRELETLKAAISKAATTEREMIASAEREGTHRLLDMRSFYLWLEQYEPRGGTYGPEDLEERVSS